MPFSQAILPSKSLLSRQDSTTTFDPSLQGGNAPVPADLRPNIEGPLQKIIDQLFERCFREKRYRQVVGIAVEARKFDVIRRAILRASEDERAENRPRNNGMGQAEELLEYLLGICMDVVQERGLRQELLRLILGLLRDVPSPDVFSIAKCIVYLNEDSMASRLLADLVEIGGPRRLAEAYQIAFDLFDNSSQEFLKKVREGFPKDPEPSASQPTDSADKMDEDNADGTQETDRLLPESNGQTEAPSSSIDNAPETRSPWPQRRRRHSIQFGTFSQGPSRSSLIWNFCTETTMPMSRYLTSLRIA